MIELADKNIDEWILEGQSLMNEMCTKSLTQPDLYIKWEK